MPKTFEIVIIVIVLLVQIAIVMPGPVNLSKVPYRQQERFNALKAMVDNPSPATKAAFKEEQRLVSHYVTQRQFMRSGIIFAVLLAFDVAVISYLNQVGKVKGRLTDR